MCHCCSYKPHREVFGASMEMPLSLTKDKKTSSMRGTIEDIKNIFNFLCRSPSQHDAIYYISC